MKYTPFKITQFTAIPIVFTLLIIDVAAQQSALEKERAMMANAAGDGYFYTIVLVVGVAILGAFILWRRSKSAGAQSQSGFDNRHQDRMSNTDYEDEGVDAEKELEWFRLAKKSSPKANARLRNTEKRRAKLRSPEPAVRSEAWEDPQLNSKLFQEKMKKLQYAQLPINSFLQLTDARPFDQLPLSADPGLLSAIEQANEEYEEDEAVRELAVRVLAAFRYRNSVESLSQIALYDLSANVRSKAVSILAGFDHESVFEAILLACADPTREVRAAAARGLFRLSFDRAEAWKRLITTRDEFRMSHAARAAVESGIVQKSFDRLLHEEMRIAYEAFALVGLLIKSGETEQVFLAIRESRDQRVKLALLHVLSVVKDERSIAKLNKLQTDSILPPEIAAKIKETIENFSPVSA